jgi:predicted phage terminase large subunit-like protein
MGLVEFTLEEAQAARRRRSEGQRLEEEAHQLAGSLKLFTRAAWPHVVPAAMVWTWHLDVMCEHLQAAYERQLPRLLITIPPGYLKSSLVSVIAPAWDWTVRPWEQIVSATHGERLTNRDTRRTRSLVIHPWFQARWGHMVQLLKDENRLTRFTNEEGGYRVGTHVEGGTGERGSVLILDDPLDAQDALSLTEAKMGAAREWLGNTWASRLNMTTDDPGVRIVVGQRVHENDPIGYLLQGDKDAGRWHHLCLPARYDPSHTFVYPDRVKLPSGQELQGDPRTEEGELLAPAFMDEAALTEVQADMSTRTIEAQYQQNPTPREGAILKRADWRYFPREHLDDEHRHRLPVFRLIVCSWDTSFKAKVTSDKVAGGVWGASMHGDGTGADLYLLAARHERMTLQQTKDAMLATRQWCVERWPQVPVYVLIEKSANGVEIIEQLQREITGVVVYTASVDKKVRAEAASPALESHNVFVPGAALPNGTGPDAGRTDGWVMDGIEQCARFRGVPGDEDDWVDQFTQAVNWVRTKDLRPSTVRAPEARIGSVGGMAVRGGAVPGVSVRRGY